MGQAKVMRGITDYDPAKVVSLFAIFTDWSDKTNVGVSTFHVDVETTAIDAIAAQTRRFEAVQLAQAVGEGFMADEQWKNSERFAAALCAYAGSTQNYAKLKQNMGLGANGYWIKVLRNSALKQGLIARPAMISGRDRLMAIMEQVREKGAHSLDREMFMNLIGSPQEPEFMHGYDPASPPKFTTHRPDESGMSEGQHRSIKLAGRWYTKK